jgi:HEAT repeat protein
LLTVAIFAPAATLRADDPGPVPSPPAAAPDESDIGQLSQTLTNPSSSPVQLEEAAKRLLERNSREAANILKQGLQNGGPPVQTAIARAISAASNPDAAYIPLLEPLLGQGQALSKAAAQALVNYPNQPTIFEELKGAATRPSIPEAFRIQIIRAMGAFFDKKAAEFLIDRMNNDRSEAVKLAAMDALAEMTGLRENGQDHNRWQKWWDGVIGQTPERWKTELLDSRAREFVQMRQRYSDLVDELQELLAEQYRMVGNPDAKKSDAILRYLQSGVPDVRLDGIKLVTNDFNDQKPISPEVHQQLRAMVSDSDKNVRLEVARTLQTIYDTDAATVLITQLGQEPDWEVRRVIAHTLGEIGDLRAVPVLVKMLDDAPVENATEAATALGALGEKLRQDNSQAALLKQVVDAVRRTFDTRTGADHGGPQSDKLRAACVSALAALGDARSSSLFPVLLRPNESENVRAAALHGLGILDDPTTVGLIAEYLTDPNPQVQLEAAKALRNMATFKQAEVLYKMVNGEQASSPQVRDEAWKTLKVVLSGGSPEDLNDWPGRFKDDPEKQLEVLDILQTALEKAKDPKLLAINSETMADLYLTPKLNRPLDAIGKFQIALDYWQNEGKGDPSELEGLVSGMLDARLAARQWTEAVNFASAEIALSDKYQEVVGPKIKKAAEDLYKDGKKDDALQLIDAALNMADTATSKRLALRYQDNLKDIRSQVNQAPTPGQ